MQQSPNFLWYFPPSSCYIDLYVNMHIYRAWLARAAVSCFYLLFYPFPQVVIRPVRQHVSFILNHWHLGGLTFKGSCSPLTKLSIFAFFHFVLTYPLLPLLSTQGEEDCAYMDSIFSEYPDAFGVFECPHLYWARKYLILILLNYLWSQNMIY